MKLQNHTPRAADGRKKPTLPSKLILAALLVAATTGLATVGCMSSSTRIYAIYPAKPSDRVEEIEILTQKPEKPYIIVADFQLSSASEHTIRKMAGRYGADAVLVAVTSLQTITSASQSTVGPAGPTPSTGGIGQQVFCTAIIYRQ